MLSVILIGSLALMVNMLIQVSAVVAIVGYIIRLVNSDRLNPAIGRDMGVMSMVLLFLFFSHLVQFASWALLFMYVGEFSDFSVAYYHSVVNFTSLGYGDIVMGEKWRLLGALEAANGILMFGLTTSTFVAVMNRLFARYKSVAKLKEQRSDGDRAANS